MGTVLKLGAKVFSKDEQEIGQLKSFVINCNNGKFEQLVFKQGVLRGKRKVAKVENIGSIYQNGARLLLDLDLEELEKLPVLTLYEEQTANLNNHILQESLQKPYTRMVTYRPDSVFGLDENMDDTKITGRFMQRMVISYNDYVMLGSQTRLRTNARRNLGQLTKLDFELKSGKINTLSFQPDYLVVRGKELTEPFHLIAGLAHSYVKLDKAVEQKAIAGFRLHQ
ncbi:MAG TPA: hypothetical protein VH186_08285 [Chloroflexia bacterium]|nr:hypothetical protein [Chloroflexia bacterium]